MSTPQPSESPESSASSLVRRLVGGDPAAVGEILAAAPGSDDPSLLVAAAVLGGDPALLDDARSAALTARERQLVALAEAHLGNRSQLFDGLVREHLADHPDHLLAAWVAGLPRRSAHATPRPTHLAPPPHLSKENDHG